METRRFGRTEHQSSVAILGGAAFGGADQATVDAAMELAIAAGVNHIDIAPSYGHAELRIGSWMARERGRFFFGCKTGERTAAAAAAELESSLQRLQVSDVDLYQFHAVTSMEELDKITAPGGALEAFARARRAGLARYLGITGHGLLAPRVFLEALRRMDLDTVLLAINPQVYAVPAYRRDCEELLALCRQRDVGVMALKTIARGAWGDQPHSYETWYQPWDTAETIQPAVDFCLSQPITGLCTAGDTRLLPLVLRACERFQPQPLAAQHTLIAACAQEAPLFT
ncbi:MAG: aldo/keto reductase [Chloroflexi bacterium]|nr:aldo/keto reductase [Chloroflexota bacterium]